MGTFESILELIAAAREAFKSGDKTAIAALFAQLSKLFGHGEIGDAVNNVIAAMNTGKTVKVTKAILKLAIAVTDLLPDDDQGVVTNGDGQVILTAFAAHETPDAVLASLESLVKASQAKPTAQLAGLSPDIIWAIFSAAVKIIELWVSKKKAA